MAFPTIALTLILFVGLVISSHASEYRPRKPKPKTPKQTPVHTYRAGKPMKQTPVHIYRAGKSMKHSYSDVPNPSSSLAYLFLKGQNEARAAVGLPHFTWDERLSAYAQNWANQRLDDCALMHSDGPYGENIFWGSGDADWSPELAVDSWTVERKYYDYFSNACMDGQDCGHYTQIVWKDSTHVGCAKVKCNGGLGYFITCNYNPPGNYLGDRPY